MDRYTLFLKQKELVELKNLLSECLRSLRENKKNKELSDWLKERDNPYGKLENTHRMRVFVPSNLCPTSYRDVNISAPSNVRPNGATGLCIYLGLEGTSCFVRNVKDALLEIRLEDKKKKNFGHSSKK
jgi:hypothetical protein